MNTSVLICRSLETIRTNTNQDAQHGGCGYVALACEFRGSFEDDIILCPCCSEDWVVQVTRDNIDKVTDATNRDAAQQLLVEYYARET